jgi:hypothetical protein
MTVIINPGSRVGPPRDGWTNSEATARAQAEQWLARMHADGMTDVELLDGAGETEGRWRFTFRHKVTGTEAVLETHGIDDIEAYEKDHIFTPRVYWRDSSTAEPRLEDFAAPGFKLIRTFVAPGEDT